MRLWILPLATVCAFAVGCNKSPEGGTPNTKATFKLSLPGPASQDIKQGDTRTLDASVERGSDFKSDVSLKVEAPPKVEVKLGKATVMGADADTKFTIIVTPAKDAPLGEYPIKVTGTPAGGTATTGEFKIKITGG